jgi:hypothetical protein
MEAHTCDVVVASNSNNWQFGENEVVRKENLKKVPKERKNGVATWNQRRQKFLEGEGIYS